MIVNILFIVYSVFFCIYNKHIIYIYIYICVNLITTSLSSLTGIIVNKGNHSQMAAIFRLVKYYNLPTHTHIYIYIHI